MGGFAAGFTSGYGLVNDMEERKRRQAADAANAENLKQRYELAVQEARADEEYRKYMREQADREATAAEQAAAAARDKALFDMRQAGYENTLAFRQDARAGDESAARIAASRAQEASSVASTSKTKFDLQQSQTAARLDAARRGFTQWLPMLDPNGQGVTQSVLEGLKLTEGSALHPTAMLSQAAAGRIENAMGFVRGEKPLQPNSPELLDALNLGMDANLKAIQGAVGRNGVITNADVVSYEVVGQEEDGAPVLRLNLKVDAEGGSYEAPITVGRSTDPNAPAADIRLEDIINPVIGLSMVQAAVNEDPSMKRALLEQVRKSDPERFSAAERRGEEAYKAYMDRRKGVEDPELLGPELPITYFVDDALDKEYSRVVPSNLLPRDRAPSAAGAERDLGINEMRFFLMQEAQRESLTKSPQQIDAQLERIRNYNPAQIQEIYGRYQEVLGAGGDQ